MPLDEDEEHATYDADAVAAYFAAATQAALALAEFRAPYRGRSTPVNAWWGSFDLAVSLFSGRAGRAAVGRLHHAQLDGRRGGRGRLVARRRALPEGRLLRVRAPGAGGVRGRRARARRAHAGTTGSASTSSTGTTCASDDPHARRRVRPVGVHPRVLVCDWEPGLLASADGTPPPVA